MNEFARVEAEQFASQPTTYFRRGDVVEMTYNGAVRRVVQHNRRKVLIEDENGQQTTIDPRGLRHTDKPFEMAEDALVAPENLALGAPVRLSPKGGRIPHGYSADTLFVVLAAPTASKRIRIAKFGGDGNRYLTAPIVHLVGVDPKEVLA
jgi:hypothetical protein